MAPHRTPSPTPEEPRLRIPGALAARESGARRLRLATGAAVAAGVVAAGLVAAGASGTSGGSETAAAATPAPAGTASLQAARARQAAADRAERTWERGVTEEAVQHLRQEEAGEEGEGGSAVQQAPSQVPSQIPSAVSPPAVVQSPPVAVSGGS